MMERRYIYTPIEKKKKKKRAVQKKRKTEQKNKETQKKKVSYVLLESFYYHYLILTHILRLSTHFTTSNTLQLATLSNNNSDLYNPWITRTIWPFITSSLKGATHVTWMIRSSREEFATNQHAIYPFEEDFLSRTKMEAMVRKFCTLAM